VLDDRPRRALRSVCGATLCNCAAPSVAFQKLLCPAVTVHFPLPPPLVLPVGGGSSADASLIGDVGPPRQLKFVVQPTGSR